MTERSSKTQSGVEVEREKPSPKDRRDRFIKVFVNKAEKANISKQKGRLSFSAFLRDRGLTRGDVYDPTYAAIGGIYQSACNVRDSAEELEEASIALRNFASVFHSQVGQDLDSENRREAIEDLREIAMRLQASAERMEAQANALAGQGREMGREHMREMLERYPATMIKPRKSR
ncbi:MAG: hypothetical protein COW16_06150 [Sphingomonadales bacterium CG12_big_fil_rev_8_21_14_0_65_65_10]|nr:MAG: hypothetical protein COW16_06150 [Sphingomonadales bacterium CG12_big_fil_rev_8_21_14_0_65_65_10]